MTFFEDIKSKHLTSYVLITIGDPIIHRISTQKVRLGEDYYKPLILNIPSLSESLDVENRKYKISSVRLSISDYEEDGVRFSDSLNQLMNQEVNIYYATSSCKTLEDCYLAGTFIVRSFTQDEDKIGLNCEDLSQDKLHKDLPFDDVGENSELLSKYEGKLIPMVFGSVDRSPSVLIAKKDEEYLNEVDILFDNNDFSIDFINENAAITHGFNNYVSPEYSPLFIYKGDNYINISQVASNNDIVGSSDQFTLTDSSLIKLLYKYSVDNNGSYIAENTIAYDFIEGNFLKSPISATAIDNPEYTGNVEIINYPDETFEVLYTSYMPYFNNILNSKDKTQHTYGYFGISETEGLLITSIHPYTIAGINIEFTSLTEGELQKRYFLCSLEALKTVGTANNNSNVEINLKSSPAENSTQIITTSGEAPQQVIFNNLFSLQNDYIDISSWEGDTFQIVTPASVISSAYALVKYYEFALLEYYKFDNPLNLNYYANVIGRGGPEPTLQQIYSIILGESVLGFDGTLNQDVFSLGNYAFTLDKKINSKKLLEEISASSGLFPYFKNGDFNVKSIKKAYTGTTNVIYADDILSYKYDRTKIEKVYTRVNVKYHYDYGLKDFTKETGYISSVTGISTTGDNAYNTAFFGDDFDQELVFESKYIRDGTTALNLAAYLYGLHANQHNLITVKLPLNYLNFELGDVVKFDKLIQGRKIFGEDYTKDTGRNGQTIYKYFFITQIKKNLETVEIKLYQLHNFGEFVPIPGCTDIEALNYNSEANQDDGTCQYPDPDPDPEPDDILGCTNPNAINYNSEATLDDGSCEYVIEGCTDPTALTYDEVPDANTNNQSMCIYPIQLEPPVITSINDEEPEGFVLDLELIGEITTDLSDNLINNPNINSTFENNSAGGEIVYFEDYVGTYWPNSMNLSQNILLDMTEAEFLSYGIDFFLGKRLDNLGNDDGENISYGWYIFGAQFYNAPIMGTGVVIQAGPDYPYGGVGVLEITGDANNRIRIYENSESSNQSEWTVQHPSAIDTDLILTGGDQSLLLQFTHNTNQSAHTLLNTGISEGTTYLISFEMRKIPSELTFQSYNRLSIGIGTHGPFSGFTQNVESIIVYLDNPEADLFLTEEFKTFSVERVEGWTSSLFSPAYFGLTGASVQAGFQIEIRNISVQELIEIGVPPEPIIHIKWDRSPNLTEQVGGLDYDVEADYGVMIMEGDEIRYAADVPITNLNTPTYQHNINLADIPSTNGGMPQNASVELTITARSNSQYNGQDIFIPYQFAQHTVNFSWGEVLDFRFGDVNGDDFVNVNDLVMMINYILHPEQYVVGSENALITQEGLAVMLQAGDVIQDGNINVNDLVAIVFIILES